ncbi:CCN family member 5-like [Trichomycterus rosablanca]|uniref:CCN family member 5-like n=1 Tax=Trichomycterus rosablanca TaxID=2290929 RepID=UPI002F358398
MKKGSGEVVFAVSVVLGVLTQVLCQLCGGPCRCPSSSPTCPPGVPLVPDGCGCCQICAGQEGDGCSERNVCDVQRDLQCDYSASFPDGPGECVRRNSLGCDHFGVQYEEGRSFRPSCGQLCHCTGGGVTCVPLCSEDLNGPVGNCLNPRLVRVPGRCCREWACDGVENSIVLEPAVDRSVRSWQDVPVPGGFPWSNCIEQSTEWSACSRSCGPGVSTRLSNRNWACRLETQTRLCLVRPCHRLPTHGARPEAGACESSYRLTTLMRYRHQGCHSVQSYAPVFCRTCLDERCCVPERTRTAVVTFRCPQGRITQHAVMMIESCVCHHSCPHPNSDRRTSSWI